MENKKLIRKIEYPPLGQRPVEILQSRLYQNQDTLQISLILNMRNVSGKTLSDVYVDLCCFDEAVRLISTKKGQTFENLNAPDGESFGGGHPVPLPSLRTASITATLSRVRFSDGTVWSRSESEGAYTTAPAAKTEPEDPPAPASPGGTEAAASAVPEPDEFEKTAEIPIPPAGDLLFSSRKAQRKAEKELWKDKTPLAPLPPEELDKARRQKRVRLLAAAAAGVIVLAGAGGAWQYIRVRARAFDQAVSFFEDRQYPEAAEAFDGLARFRFSASQSRDIQWYQALVSIQTGNYARAVRELGALNGWRDSSAYLRQLTAALSGVTAAGDKHSAGLKKDGTVAAVGDNSFGQCATGEWRNMTAVACGLNHTIGLKSNGTVEAVGADDFSQCALGEWHHIIAVAAGERHSVGVMNTGRVVTAGDNSFGQCDTADWSGIIAVAAGRMHTVGLRQDGTVVAVGDNDMGACNVDGWRDIVAIAAGNGFTVGVRQDGTVVAVGDNTYHECDVSGLKDVAMVSTGDFHVLALGYNGRLLTAGDNDWRQGEVALWKNLISAAGGVHHTIGVSQDGTAYAVGDNKNGQCDVWGWSDMGLPAGAIKSMVFAGLEK